MLVGILDTLAMVRLGGSLAANNRCDLTNSLLVDTLHNDGVGVGNLEGDAIGLCNNKLLLGHTLNKNSSSIGTLELNAVLFLKYYGVGVAETKNDLAVLLPNSVTNTYDLELLILS